MIEGYWWNILLESMLINQLWLDFHDSVGSTCIYCQYFMQFLNNSLPLSLPRVTCGTRYYIYYSTCSICGQFSSNLNSKQVLHKSVIWKHKIHTPSSWGIFLFFDLNASQFKQRLPLWLLVLCMVSHKW